MIVTELEIHKVCPNGHRFIPHCWSSFLEFCPDCGSRLVVEIREIQKVRCPKCGTDKWVVGWDFCGFCGYELTSEDKKQLAAERRNIPSYIK